MHGIILHEEYRDRMRKLSDEDLGKLVKNMFCIDEGEEPTPFGDEYLDFFSETVCGRLKRDTEVLEAKSKAGKKGGAPKGNQNATKTTEKQAENKQKTNRKQTETNPYTYTNTYTNTNNNIKPKKTNKFVENCSKSDIDFESLEIKVVKN